MSVTIDPPAKLPVDHLSVSSIWQFCACPEKWKRRYLDREYDPPNGKMVLGSAVHAAEAQHFSRQIDTGEGMSVEEVEDEFSAEFDDRSEREMVDWGDDKPGVLKDSGVAVLGTYHAQVVPSVVPASVERKFEMRWEGLDWSVLGFIDLEVADGAVADLKVSGMRWSQEKADAELSPSVYLAARRAEGNPAPRFDFHALVRTRQPTAQIVSTVRTDGQLDLLTDKIFSVAKEMAWRVENDVFRGATEPWLCRGCHAVDCAWRLA